MQKKYKVEEIGVFGSYARGEENDSSDIDILVSLKKKHSIGLIKFCDMQKFLSEQLGKEVDLITKKGIKSALRKYILKEVIYL